MDEFTTVEDVTAHAETAQRPQAEQAKQKAKRVARPKSKKRASVKDLPDLSNFAALFDCLHWPKDAAQSDWAAAFDKTEELGLAIIMEDKKIKGALLPFDTYNDLIGMCMKAKGAE